MPQAKTSFPGSPIIISFPDPALRHHFLNRLLIYHCLDYHSLGHYLTLQQCHHSQYYRLSIACRTPM
jgi:hypothetical protein